MGFTPEARKQAPTPAPKETDHRAMWNALKKKMLDASKQVPPEPKALEVLLYMVEEEMR